MIAALVVPAEEQLELVRQAQAGDVRARDRLVQATLGYVWTVAKKWHRLCRSHETQDLVTEGVFGVLRAIEKFDHRDGVRFLTYAAWWIRQAIQRAAVKDSTPLSAPFHALDVAVLGARPPRMREDGRRALIHLRRSAALEFDGPIGENGGTLADVVPDGRTEPDDERLGDRTSLADARAVLGTFRAALSRREQDIFDRRLMADEDTLETVGEDWCLTRERVRQIEKALRERLRAFLVARGIVSAAMFD